MDSAADLHRNRYVKKKIGAAERKGTQTAHFGHILGSEQFGKAKKKKKVERKVIACQGYEAQGSRSGHK